MSTERKAIQRVDFARALTGLTSTEIITLYQYLVLSWTYEQIAASRSISRQRVMQHIHNARRIVGKYIAEAL